MNFYKLLADYYDLIFPLNQQSVAFIDQRISKGAILDVAAGTGNHAIALAKLGYKVTATDLDENMIKKIKEKETQAQIAIDARTLAMEQLDQLNETSFATIICLGNSLVHLKNLAAVETFLAEAYKLLLPKGRLLLQVVNYDRILKEGITELPFIVREKEQLSFRRSYKLADNKVIFSGVLSVQGKSYENCVDLLPITSAQLTELVANAGFKEIELFGAFTSEAFRLNSPALILEAVK